MSNKRKAEKTSRNARKFAKMFGVDISQFAGIHVPTYIQARWMSISFTVTADAVAFGVGILGPMRGDERPLTPSRFRAVLDLWNAPRE